MPRLMPAPSRDGNVRTGNRHFKNARFCRQRDDTRRRAFVDEYQILAGRPGGHVTSTDREGRLAAPRPRNHIAKMRTSLLALALIGGLAGSVAAQVDQRFPGASSGQFAPPPPPAPTPGPPIAAYPNTESLTRDRIQSQGYKVQRLEQQNNGGWKAQTSRDAVPTRPHGVPSEVTVSPNGQMQEKRE